MSKNQAPKGHSEIIQEAYATAKGILGERKGKIDPNGLSQHEIELLNLIAAHSEDSKAVLTVLITSLVHKIFDPKQDIRKHQSNMPGGYSGRTLDYKFITPFLQKAGFPAMAESGWLTRSLEQNRPFDKKFPGKIKAPGLKSAFLEMVDIIQRGADARAYLIYLFQLLLLQKQKSVVNIAKASDLSKLSVSSIIELLDKHFSRKYSAPGAARLPVLAIYSVYECMMDEVKRFSGKELLPLESHTSADVRSGIPGDIVVKSNGAFFEGVEVKLGHPITQQLAFYAYTKFSKHPVNRYYLLSTLGIKDGEEDAVNAVIEHAAEELGCQFIINGVLPTLKYYLRLLENADKFLDNYTKNVIADLALKFEHKQELQKLLAEKAVAK